MDTSLLQLILEDHQIAYLIADRDLIVLEVGGDLSICGHLSETCVGRSLLDLLPELVGCEEALFEILAGSTPDFRLPWVNRETAGGETTYLGMVSLPYKDQCGQIAGLLHIVQDVTEVGALQQRLTQHGNELRLLRDQLTRQNLELAAANTELRRLDELKTEFVMVAAHELRAPLSSIMGYIEVLLDEDADPLTDRQKDFLDVIERSGHRLMDITRNLLDATRIETGRIELVLQPTDLAALVNSVAIELGRQLEAKHQRLTLHTPARLPLALCDETRAAQIISNLLSNASKYTREGGQISIKAALAEEEGFLQVSVADNGVGIAPGDRDKLFSRFFRAGSASRTQASGVGLGLYITRSLVELHGGRIWFESELGMGSTFHATLPIADRPTEF